MQATEAIKLITGIGEVLVNKLMTFSILTYDNFIIEIAENKEACSYIPVDALAFKATDYNWLCGTSVNGIEDLDAMDFIQKSNFPDTVVIDVREPNELPKANFINLNIPLSMLSMKIPEIGADKIILFCQSGKRSLKAGQLLLDKFGTSKKISHLKGGIIALQENTNE